MSIFRAMGSGIISSLIYYDIAISFKSKMNTRRWVLPHSSYTPTTIALPFVFSHTISKAQVAILWCPLVCCSHLGKSIPISIPIFPYLIFSKLFENHSELH